MTDRQDYDALADRTRNMTHAFIFAQDVILDPRTRKSVAVIRNGQVFRDDQEGAKIAMVVGSSLYDLKGNLIAYLHGGGMIEASPRPIPIAFRNLLEGSC
jgi:hypothetical protein